MKRKPLHIPERVMICGQEFTVDSQIVGHSQSALGASHPHFNRILIATEWDAHKLAPSQIEDTYVHELVHQVLNYCGHQKLSDDEDFVSCLSSLLHQALTRHEGDFKKAQQISNS